MSVFLKLIGKIGNHNHKVGGQPPVIFRYSEFFPTIGVRVRIVGANVVTLVRLALTLTLPVLPRICINAYLALPGAGKWTYTTQTLYQTNALDEPDLPV